MPEHNNFEIATKRYTPDDEWFLYSEIQRRNAAIAMLMHAYFHLGRPNDWKSEIADGDARILIYSKLKEFYV